MDDGDVLEVLLEVASDLGLRVQVAGREARGVDSLPITSGICKVRGEWWVVLSSIEPTAAQIRTLAEALRKHAGTALEERHLPPAVRAVLEGPAG